jgi:hypothetical protein
MISPRSIGCGRELSILAEELQILRSALYSGNSAGFAAHFDLQGAPVQGSAENAKEAAKEKPKK